MNLVSLCLDLLFPIIIVDLYEVEDSVHKNTDVWIFI